MGHPSGFLDHERKSYSYLPVDQRVKTWKEFTIPLADEELAQQGARCMDCGIPFCHATGCPVYNLIPEWNDLVYKGDWREALVRLEMTNNLSEVTDASARRLAISLAQRSSYRHDVHKP